MLKKINEYVFKNIGWKVLAVILAVFLWLLCLNLTENIITKPFTVPLTFVNEDVLSSNDYVLLNDDELLRKNVQVNVTTDTAAFSGISAGNFMAYIDLAPLNYISENNINKDQSINVEIDITGVAYNNKINNAMLNAEPSKVTIVVDKLNKETKAVTVNTSGTAGENYIALAGSTYPETVEISGPSTVLNRISTVSVDVNVEGATAEVLDTFPLRVFDIYKEDITDQVELNVSTVEVKVPINMSAKIPMDQKIIGQPEEGYSVTSRESSIEYVEVVGDPDDIRALKSISLPDFNVAGRSSSATDDYDLRKLLMDTNLSIKNGTPHEVTVTVNIEQLMEKEVAISEYNINVYGLSNKYPLQFSQSEVSFTVRGLPDKITEFTSDDIITASINVSGLEPGVHEVPVNIILPKDVSILGDSPIIEVTISEAYSDEDLENNDNDSDE